MKLRFILVLTLLVSGLFLGLGSAQSAHAATATQLTATDMGNLQAVLNVTKVALDAIQVQIDHKAVKDPAAMIVTLNGIKGYLIGIRGILGGSPVAAVPVVPVIAAQPAPQIAAASTVSPEPGSQTVAQQSQNQQTASVSASATSKWAFWVILIVAVVLAIVMAMPRKAAISLPEAPQTASQMPQPPLPVAEEQQSIQSA